MMEEEVPISFVEDGPEDLSLWGAEQGGIIRVP